MGWPEKLANSLTELCSNWRLPLESDDVWLESLKSILRRKMQDFPYCPIPLVLGRGLIDLLYAAMPTEEVVMGLTQSGNEYAKAMDDMARMAIDVINVELATLQPFWGGYANRRGLWAPGTICLTQEDGTSLISPKIYQDLILPHDRKIWSAFDFSMIHTHSPGLPIMIDGLISTPELTAIESMVDPHGLSVDALMPHWRKIQSADKALLICSELDPDSIEQIANELKPNGLAFCISTAERTKYNRLLGKGSRGFHT